MLPSYGLPLVIGAVVAAVAFVVWERFSRTRLIDPAGVQFRPFLAALGASFAAGAALMVTLVDVELFGQGVLGMDQNKAAGMLLSFLIALPIGAVLGGLIATRVGDRAMTFVGLLIAAYGYWLISHWPVDLPNYRHNIFGLFTVPAMHADLLVAGLGLGLVIGPLTSAALRVVPAAQHGIASAAVVVARMTGMLIGVAALSAWGLYRFNQIVAGLSAKIPPNATLMERWPPRERCTSKRSRRCTATSSRPPSASVWSGALLGLLISGRKEHADEPEVPEQETVALGER